MNQTSCATWQENMIWYDEMGQIRLNFSRNQPQEKTSKQWQCSVGHNTRQFIGLVGEGDQQVPFSRRTTAHTKNRHRSHGNIGCVGLAEVSTGCHWHLGKSINFFTQNEKRQQRGFTCVVRKGDNGCYQFQSEIPEWKRRCVHVIPTNRKSKFWTQVWMKPSF